MEFRVFVKIVVRASPKTGINCYVFFVDMFDATIFSL